MLSEQAISITDLRKNTSDILSDLSLPKYVFVHNKPTAVVMNMKEYETLKRQAFIQDTQKEVEETKKIWKKYKTTKSFMDDLFAD